MKGETERIVRRMAGAKTDREPSRLAGCGVQCVGNVRSLPCDAGAEWKANMEMLSGRTRPIRKS